MKSRARRLIRLAVVGLLLSLLACAVFGDSVRLAWDASPSQGVAGYRIYYGTNSGVYSFVTNAGLVLTQTVVLPWRGRWFFAATAYDTNMFESRLINEVEWEARPEPPGLAGEAVVRLAPVIERSTNLVDWSSVVGEPTFFPATNSAEFFRTMRLMIELVSRVE